jgi:hypothetical protein
MMRALRNAAAVAVLLGLFAPLLFATCQTAPPEPVRAFRDDSGAPIVGSLVSHVTKVAPDEAAGEMVIDDQDTFPAFTIGPRGFCRPGAGWHPYERTCCLGKVCAHEHRSIVEP